jgi:hypothetical protein
MHPEAFDNYLMGDCNGTQYFRMIWTWPKDPARSSEYYPRYKVPDRWEAEVSSEWGGVSRVRYSIRDGNTEYPEMTGSARLDGSSGFSLRVRGEFGSDGWGDWSKPTSMVCFG